MNIWEAILVTGFLGEDVKFWVTVLIGLLLKWLFTPKPGTLREAMSGIAAGATLAYYGADWVINNFSQVTEADRNLVVIGLVISGEHIVRALVSYGPKNLTRALGVDEDEEKAKERQRKQEENESA